ncbi:MAG: hypothetical protein K8R02_06995 [Anaerohalosphaeraceae bacterium]|nr:hypothetical protein [Anaerohalosphaeraceae bacterium]
MKERPAVCIERARYYTRFLRDMSSSSGAAIMRRAKAVNFYLSNKEPLFFDDNLLAGTTTSKPLGAPLYPEFTGLSIWPELDAISTRMKNPISLTREEADELNFEIFPYWMDRSLIEYTRKKYSNPSCMRLAEHSVFFSAGKANGLSHTVPHYRTALEKGLEDIINEASLKEKNLLNDKEGNRSKVDFYQAVQIVLKGVITYAQNLARRADELSKSEPEPAKKENLQKMCDLCSRIPAKPVTTFREAVNAIWIIQIAIHAENENIEISPGRLDQVLYKYYKNDIEAGILTVKEAMELIGCLWLRFNDNEIIVSETCEELYGGIGTVPSVTIGGVDENGEDAVNELTYIMLRVTELLKIKSPSLNARYHYEKNSEEYRRRIAEVIANTKTVPSIYNDITNILTLQNQGVTIVHARDYAIIGCTGIAAAGKSYDSPVSIIFNLVSVLELTLYNGKRPVTGDELIGLETGDPSQFTTFEEFLEAFKKQFVWLAGQAITLNEYLGHVAQEILPSPLLSSFFEGPMAIGRDVIHGGALYNSSGATHIGFADTVDSLNSIEKAVFQEKKCTLSELIEALKADFRGHEKIHAYLINKTPKYGTEDAIAVKNSQKLMRYIYDFYQSFTNYRGGKYRPGYWTITHHAGWGRLSGALPNGRTAYRVLAGGINPSSQAASNLSVFLRTVGSLDSLCIPGGGNVDVKYERLLSKEDLELFGLVIEASFRSGMLNMQLSILSYEILLQAKQHPEKYPELIVRVSGYPAYFTDLNEALKEELITRTEYSLNNGIANTFPEAYSFLLPYK